jgi:hypothetical protein
LSFFLCLLSVTVADTCYSTGSAYESSRNVPPVHIIYSDPQYFDGFRFSKLSVLDGDVAETKYPDHPNT